LTIGAASPSSATFSGVIQNSSSGALSVTQSGTGTTILSGTNAYTGGTTITAGVLEITNSNNNLGTGNIIINGGRLATVSGDTVTIGPGQNIQLGPTLPASGSNLSATGSASALFTIDGTISDLTTGGVLGKTGGGVLILGGMNTYTGPTTVNLGTLQAGSTQAFGIGSAVTVSSGTLLDLNGYNNTIGSLAGAAGDVNNSSSTAATLTIGGSATTTFSGIIENIGSGGLSITQAGTGTQTLGGANTFTGSTTVQKGDLNISGSITGSTVTVTPSGANTATLSSGITGTTSAIAPTVATGNAVVIGGGAAGSSAILAPGDSANPNTLGQIGAINFTLQQGAHFDFGVHSTLRIEISSPTSYDSLDFTAPPASGEWLTGAGNATLQLNGTINYGDSYVIVADAIANGYTGAFTFANITGYDTADYQAEVTQSGENYDLSFSQLAVPEPSAAGSILAGAFMLGLLGRFRRPLG
jgi:autotransporter-associated beta strand protein